MVRPIWIMKESSVLQYKYVTCARAEAQSHTAWNDVCVQHERVGITAHVVPLYIPDSLTIIYGTNDYRRYEGWYQKIP